MNIKYAVPRSWKQYEDTRCWRTLTEKDSLASQIIADYRVEDDDTYVIYAVIDSGSVNDDAASKFIEMLFATWLVLIVHHVVMG